MLAQISSTFINRKYVGIKLQLNTQSYCKLKNIKQDMESVLKIT